ncbi:hypothetical protein AB434_2894 [Heyndrickxia coagulans]|uniref:Uncharacterized protein n=2 Tax=Heyndrickxia coagulans TaxID=1398 RepID=G2TMD5_HEYCO|nr:hypothetical protein Bcoa_3261 [Heyndrickxia coagulans 36D1]AJO23197.1 hypothetical protein SB48_HM08orf03800 [Heyndrickxia coagulans]AKN55299.1 hypothetical protein AB434_2894 [Heyndrickxia coagulans]KYC59091.1 hypothetical protein B4100_3592 [Heyndrickxia coagulans]KYC69504.1 hypothetical protein B4096_3478 [Heyndrickxia coagulans]
MRNSGADSPAWPERAAQGLEKPLMSACFFLKLYYNMLV